MVVKAVTGSHFRVGEFTTHFGTYFSGGWDVHWLYGVLTHGQVVLTLEPKPKSIRRVRSFLQLVARGERPHLAAVKEPTAPDWAKGDRLWSV